MSHRDTDQPRVDRDLRDQLVRENGLTPYYINDAERQDREAAREWLNESVFDWTLPEHEIQLASEGSGGGGLWDGSMPVRLRFQASPCAFSTTEAPGAPVDDVVEHAQPVALKESMIAALGVERTPAVARQDLQQLRPIICVSGTGIVPLPDRMLGR